MLSDIRNTIKQSAVYGISRIAAKSVSFILLPLYTSIFSSENIANINLLESFWQYIFTICLFSFETAIIAYCVNEKDENKVRSIFLKFFILLIFNSLILITLGYFSSGFIALIFLNDQTLQQSVFYCFIISSFEALLVIPLTIARLHQKPVLYTFISTANLIINLLLQFYLLLKISIDINFIFISKSAAPIIVFIFLLPYTLKHIKIGFESISLKTIYKFTFPLMAASLLALFLNTINRYILVDFVSKTDVAIYTLGNSIGSVTNFFVVSPFVLAFSVISWKKLKDENSERFFTKTTTYLFYVMIYISLIISLFIPEVIKLFILNSELWKSVGIIRIILFSNCIAALYYISIQSYYFTKRTDLIFWIFAACLAFNIISNFVFARYFGIYGAAYLSVISYLLLIFLSYKKAMRIYPIYFENKKLILLSIIYLFFVFISYYFKLDYLYQFIGIKILFVISFPFILYLFRFYEQIEINRIKEILKNL